MLHTLWSVKGGSGVTVTSALLGSLLARRHGRAVVVDLCGDQPAAMGLADPSGPGVLDWLAAADGPPEALERLLRSAPAGVELLPRGRPATGWGPGRSADLVEGLRELGCPVVVDAGVVRDEPWIADPRVELAHELARAGRSTVVTRSCYLAMRHGRDLGLPADSAVLVREAERALDGGDVAIVLDVPVVATVQADPAIARAVDSGMLLRRARRSLDSALGRVT